MKFILNTSTNPFYNLALEEYVLKNADISQDYFIIWQNEPTIVIGKYQNALNEINTEFVKQNNINVVRRISGGGAVYHDMGNINFTFITKYDEKLLLDFKKFTVPVIYALGKLNIEAGVSGRNDIQIGEKKISGNAQHIYKDRFLHHGTLLFNSELENVVKSLNVDKDKIISKGIASVKSRITNIKDHLKSDISVDEFKRILISNIYEFNRTIIEEHKLSDKDVLEIEKLRKEKYETWEWNYGVSPEFDYKNSMRFEGGKIETLLNIVDGSIRECKIYGDFLGLLDINEIEKRMIDLKYREEDIDKFLMSIDIKRYFGTLTKDQIKACLFA